MARITDEQLHRAFEIINDEAHAKARAAHEYMDDLTKTVLAKLMASSNAKSAVEREQYARSHPDFEAHLKAVQEVAELDYVGRQKTDAAKAVFEAWRTIQANDRALEKIR